MRGDGFFPTVSTAAWGGRSTRAEVSLDAIAFNIRALAHHAAPAQLIAVVKADAYGHGAPAVARTALDHGATSLAVYAVDEAIGLRRSGLRAPILLFGPIESGEVGDVWEHNLTPTITSLQTAEALQAASAGRVIPVHLKVDTGLTRSGVSPGNALDLAHGLRRYPALQLEGVYTHFARADESDNTSALCQLHCFHTVLAQLRDQGVRFSVAHAANSAATINIPETRLDAVRVGISTYGYYPSTEVSRVVPLRPALSLLSTVTRLLRIPAGTGVGYGHEFTARRDALIALIPIGYGDGLPRSLGLGNGGVIIRGERAPIVGRVSMDQITVDVSEVEGIETGDEVVLIGRQGKEQQTADDLAARAGTISYEILAGILPRVPRLYALDQSIVAASRLTRVFEA